jgi:DHA3 family macrolide efflux protein-like MFS transporter
MTARFHRGKLVVWGLVFMGLPLVLFAFFPSIYLNAALLAVMGLMNGIVNISVITVFQQRVPDAMMGRVFGLLTGLGMFAAPLGIALGGFAADYISLTALFAAMGGAMALVGFSLFRQPAVAELA